MCCLQLQCPLLCFVLICLLAPANIATSGRRSDLQPMHSPPLLRYPPHRWSHIISYFLLFFCLFVFWGGGFYFDVLFNGCFYWIKSSSSSMSVTQVQAQVHARRGQNIPQIENQVGKISFYDCNQQPNIDLVVKFQVQAHLLLYSEDIGAAVEKASTINTLQKNVIFCLNNKLEKTFCIMSRKKLAQITEG